MHTNGTPPPPSTTRRVDRTATPKDPLPNRDTPNNMVRGRDSADIVYGFGGWEALFLRFGIELEEFERRYDGWVDAGAGLVVE
jgi:hypothetical protein